MLAIIGGTGVYNIEGLKTLKEINVKTPYGETSAPIIKTSYAEKEIYFLARHGQSHQLLPHEVNYRANIWALKSLGVKQIIGVSAVGSLNINIKPGEFSIPQNYFDHIKGNREKTFFGEGLAAHVSTAKCVCENLTTALKETANELNETLHTKTSYIGVDGPRLGTKIESNFYKEQVKADLIGMTNVPEVFLAREAQICYATIGVVTDFDCWLEDESQHVSVANVMALYGQSIERVKKLLMAFLEKDLPKIDPAYREILQFSVLTPKEALTPEKAELLRVLSL